MARMAKRLRVASWARAFERSMAALARSGLRATQRSVRQAMKPTPVKKRAAPAKLKTLAAGPAPVGGEGDWIAGVALGVGGARRYGLFRPAGVKAGERLPLLVMLHGCGQDAKGFALSTRMNRVAAREHFMVLYPEQDRLANAQGCWNWFDTTTGRAMTEVALILRAIDQVCLLYPADRERVAIAGLSAGASMAALVVTRHPERFKALAMHSGIAPGTAHSTLSALGAMQGRRGTRPLAQVPPPTLAASQVNAASPCDAAPFRDGRRLSSAQGRVLPPLLVIHGAADRVVSARNGQAAALQWADASGARAGAARQLQRGQRYPMTVTDFKRHGSTVATRVEVARLGHAWSGGMSKLPYGDGLGPDASRMVWAFVKRQFRVPKAKAAAVTT